MPFRTQYGSHYHMTYGCHGATVPCSTEGFDACTDCCGTRGAGLSESLPGGGAGAGVAAIMSVPSDKLTGEMIATEFRQDYTGNEGEFDREADALAAMPDARERALAAQAFVTDLAAKRYDRALRSYIGLAEGEEPDESQAAVAGALTTAAAAAAFAGAYHEHIAAAPADAASRVDPALLATEMADRVAESGFYGWFSEPVRDSISFALPEDAHMSFDMACALLEERYAHFGGSDVGGAKEISDMGAKAVAGTGQAAPDEDIVLVDEPVDTGIQQFDRIGIVNGTLTPTEYGDGFDVGDVLFYDVGWSMTLPHFALVVRRTPKMIETIDLPTIRTPTDGYGQVGRARPVPIYDMTEEHPRARYRMNKRGEFNVAGHYTRPWDGSDKMYDYMD